MIHMGSYLNRW